MTTCPLCGAKLERHSGLIEQTVYRYLNRSRRKTHLGTFVACPDCEFCEEVR